MARPLTLHKTTHKEKKMTDDLYDDAKQEFPTKYDMKDRLVAIWVTGKKGERPGANGKSYGWAETITLVLDDPNGVLDWDGQVKNEDGDWVETLVPSVVVEGPARLEKFQWSAGGIFSRLEPRITLRDKQTDQPIYRPMIGRINERKSTTKGQNNPWSIATPTDTDKATANRFEDKIRAITLEVKAMREGSGSDSEAFD